MKFPITKLKAETRAEADRDMKRLMTDHEHYGLMLAGAAENQRRAFRRAFGLR